MSKPRDPSDRFDLSGFDFDAWSDLFQNDPKAFERRRRQWLQAELAKGSNRQREHMAAVLDAYDERVRDLSAGERLQVASEFAFGSLHRLQAELSTLRNALNATLPATQRTANSADTADVRSQAESKPVAVPSPVVPRRSSVLH